MIPSPISLLCLVGALALAHAAPAPFILVPGITASLLQASFGPSPPLFCPPGAANVSVWPFPEGQANDSALACAATVLTGGFDRKSGAYRPPKDTVVDIVDFGGFGGIKTSHYDVDTFTAYGFVVGQTMFGAPYDWRYAPDNQALYYSRLKGLFEESLRRNGQRTALLSSSNGPMIALGFLAAMEPAWLHKHVAGFFASSPAFGGTTVALLTALQGRSIKGLPTAVVRDLLLSWPSVLWNMDRAGNTPGTRGPHDALVTTPDKVYAAYETDRVLEDAGLGLAADLYRHVANVTSQPFHTPTVPTFVSYGTGYNTAVGLVYTEALPHNAAVVPQPPPTGSHADGDGVVSADSSMRGQQSWAAKMAARNVTLVSRSYPMLHAQCFVTPDCMEDFLTDLKSVGGDGA